MTPLSIFARGMAMGAADIVPGVSGGTIAFITGIYPTLLHSLTQFDLTAVKLVLRGDFAGVWRHVNGGFLLALLLGIATSLASLARLISWLLHTYPEPLWGFFFGLILASALLLLGQVGPWRWPQLVSVTLGLVCALTISLMPGGSFIEGNAGIFLAGFFAICAMILPGISGSFILVLLGMYSSVLAALKGLEIGFLLLFAFGAGCGLMCFSRFLEWLLKHFYQATIALLTGFLFGSLTIVWPWKRVLEWVVGREGQLKPVQQWPVLPGEYLTRTGEDPMVLMCSLAALTGLLLVWLLDRKWGRLQVESP
jgi:putative membrane protein